MQNVIEVYNHLAGKNAKQKTRAIVLPDYWHPYGDEVSLCFVSYNGDKPFKVDNRSMTIREMRELANAMLEICNRAESALKNYGVNLENHYQHQDKLIAPYKKEISPNHRLCIPKDDDDNDYID